MAGSETRYTRNPKQTLGPSIGDIDIKLFTVRTLIMLTVNLVTDALSGRSYHVVVIALTLQRTSEAWC